MATIGAKSDEHSFWDIVFSLPRHVALQIIKRMQRQDRSHLRSLCKEARQLVNAAVTDVRIEGADTEHLSLLRLADRFPDLQELRVTDTVPGKELTDGEFAEFVLSTARRLHRFCSLDLRGCRSLSLSSLLPLSQYCSQLQKFVFNCSGFGPRCGSLTAVLSILTGLHVLVIESCTGLEDLHLHSLSTLTRLTQLYLSDCERLGAGCTAVIASELPTVQRLMLKNMKNGVCGSNLSDLTGLRALTDLNLDSNQIPDIGLLAVAEITQLVCLSISEISDASDRGFNALSALVQLEKLVCRNWRLEHESLCILALPKLRHLECHSIMLDAESFQPGADGASFEDLLPRCGRSLVQLWLTDWTDSLSAMFPLPSLMRLAVQHGDHMMLGCIVAHQPSLQELDLGCSGLPGESVEELLPRLTNLRRLALRDLMSHEWEPPVDRYLVECSRLAFLTALVLDCCGASDLGLMPLMHLKSLRSVTLEHCNRLQGACLAALARLPALDEISVSGCECLSWEVCELAEKIAHAPDIITWSSSVPPVDDLGV